MEIRFSSDKTAKILGWKIKEGAWIPSGHTIFSYSDNVVSENSRSNVIMRYKSPEAGVVTQILAAKGAVIINGTPLYILDTSRPCSHPTVIRDLCAECGVDLQKLDDKISPTASVSMVHSVPDLRVSKEQAQILGKGDEQRLLKQRKLVLLVDLDQTLIHTTNDPIPINMHDVFHFQLWGHGSVWYHTRLRPHTRSFLEKISRYYELHICTFGTRSYAHRIAHELDPDKKYFFDRILSRDECFSQNSKTANLKELFPRGDHMVCIIDDREDVWNFAPNLIHVKPYHYFRHTGDINAPPGLSKMENDEKDGFDFDKVKVEESKNQTPTGKGKPDTPELPEKSNSQKEESSIKTKSVDANSREEKDKSNKDNAANDTKNVSNDLLLSDDEDSDTGRKDEEANEGDMEESPDEELASQVAQDEGDEKYSQPSENNKAILENSSNGKGSINTEANLTAKSNIETENLSVDKNTENSKAGEKDVNGSNVRSDLVIIEENLSVINNKEAKVEDLRVVREEEVKVANSTETSKEETKVENLSVTITDETRIAKCNTSKEEVKVENLRVTCKEEMIVENIKTKFENVEAKVENDEAKVENDEAKVENDEAKVEIVKAKVENVEAKVENLEAKVENLGAKVENVEAKVENVETKVENVEAKVESVETKGENVEVKVEKVETNVKNVEAKVESVKTKVENMETSAKAVVKVKNEVTKEDGEFTDSSTTSSPQNSQQPPPTNNLMEDNDKDDYLLYLEEILKSIHGAFYKLLDEGLSRGEKKVPDIKDVIPYVRLKVLKGCSLVFSGVVPTEVPLAKSRPYGVALALGAQVSDRIIPPCKSGTSSSTEIPTTHVVAARMGTEKVKEARRYKGIHIVTPNWLWCCAERWDRVEERIFPLYKKSNVKRNPPAHCSSPELSLHHSKGEYNVMSCLSPIDQHDNVFVNKGSVPSNSKNGQPTARKERTPSGRFMDTINPLLTFSIDEIASMGHEVDDICNESESSSSDDSESKVNKERVPRKKKPRMSIETPVPISHNSNDSSSSSDDSEDIKNENSSQESPCNFRKRKRQPKTETETEDEPLSAKFRRGEPLPSDLECLNLAHGSTDDDQENDQEDEWMAEALEREFLDSNSQESQDC